MMGSHQNEDHVAVDRQRFQDVLDEKAEQEKLLERLAVKSAVMTANQSNTIAAGAAGEKELAVEEVGMFVIRQLPDDPDCLRISIGEPAQVALGSYIVIRGHVRDAVEVLERAVCALKVSKLEAFGENALGENP